MDILHIAFLFLSTALVSFAATGLALRFLKRQNIVDTPNARSSHITPTPRGGGIAVILVIVIAWALALGEALPQYKWLLLAALFLAGVSWIDDLRGLSARFRLFAQFAAVSIVFSVMPNSAAYFHGAFPLWLDHLLASILWIWFINLFNFMDGIDGITVVESSTIGLGAFLLMMVGDSPLTLGLLGLIITAGVIGFLRWNWHPAKVFLGDVGSVPLGFLLGWLLLEILASPYWPVAIILPLYYLADATLTLVRRGLRGERVWQAHREHFYQQATGRGFSHARVSLLIAGANILLIGLALFSLSEPWLALLGAGLVVGILLMILRGKNGKEAV